VSRRVGLVAAAVALGLAAGLAALALRDGTPVATSPPSSERAVRVEAAVAPRVSLFGDPVVASVDVLFDRRVVRPESVGIDASFEPWKPQGTAPPARSESGDLVRLSYRITLTCAAIECLPAGSAQQFQFPSGQVHYGLRVQPGRVVDTFTWQTFQIVSRVTEEEVDAARWRADLRTLPAVSYRISPGTLGALLLGAAGLHTRAGEGAREIGYWIHKAHLRQGLATEAAAALTRAAFEIERVKRVEIHCDPQNVHSAAIPKKLGYLCEATLRGRLPLPDGTSRDTMIWTLFAPDYPASPAASTQTQAFDALGRQLL